MKKILFVTALTISGLLAFSELYAEKEFRAKDFSFQSSNPVELGNVRWQRNYQNAVKTAKSANKPVLILFQEVPGCRTSSGYGKNVLSHPLIIDAIENEFVPLAVYNNTDGHDREILQSFNEPSWNNPVVRIINADRKELAPRLSGNYTKLGLVKTIKAALEKSRGKAPEYLALLAKELKAEQVEKETAVFAMHCFWTGEGRLGSIDGVISTEPGFMGGREVVKVEFNPESVSFKQLLSLAIKNNVARHVYTDSSTQKKIAEDILGSESVSDNGNFRPDSQPKYYMSKTPYRFIPMTPLQASKVNSAIGFKSSPDKFLSERQLMLLNFVKANPDKNRKSQIENKDFIAAWNQAFSQVETRLTKKLNGK